MIIYLYNPLNGEYIGEYSPQINPKNMSEYLYPPNSTLIKPIKKNGFYPVFENGNWVQVVDFRGQEVIDLESKIVSVVDYLGEIKNNCVLYETYKLSEEYKKWQNELSKQQNIQCILNQIEELDRKRIRAICEPGMRDDGSTWLDYYNNQIIELRKKMKEV